jgi:transposase InsO family protein
MPWKTLSEEEDRRRFVMAMGAKQSFAALCRKHGISRKTGYKWRRRFEQRSELRSRSRRPIVPSGWEIKWRRRLLAWRKRRPSWGGAKLHHKLRRLWPRVRLPAVRTLERWLSEAQVVRRSKRRAKAGPVQPRPGFIAAVQANDVWPVDFKGRFRGADGHSVEPLTVSDLATRYGLAAQLLPAKTYACTRAALIALFKRHGLPRAIRVDNGPPFGGDGSLGLSRLSAEWTRLGIQVQFGRPACPQDNAEHERWHRTLQEDFRLFALRPGEDPQQRLDRLVHLYNHDRSHDSLGGRRPAELYRPSRRRYREPRPRNYPARWPTLVPNRKGCAWWAGRQRAIGKAFAGHKLGLRPVEPGHWEVYLDYLVIGLLVATDRGAMRPSSIAKQCGEGCALPSSPPSIYRSAPNQL